MKRFVIGIILACVLTLAIPLSGYLTARTFSTTACVDPGLKDGLDAFSIDATLGGQDFAAGMAEAEPGTGQRLPTSLQAAGTTLAGEQISNAAVIIAEGRAARVPPRGWVVALATALQESGLRALNYGDRDSQGIFQQRPAAGWGTPDQIRSPSLSARAFYGVADHTANPGLLDIVGWPTMTIAEAAQAVQRSAFPDAYAKWEPAAKSIIDQLGGPTGYESSDRQQGMVACEVDAAADGNRCPPTGLDAERGLTADALLVVRCTKERFPQVATVYGVGHRANNPSSDHPNGGGVDLMVSDLPDYQPGVGSAYGWQIARWLRANHRALGVTYVIYAATIWSVERDSEDWRPYRGLGGSSDTVMHYDHVHVSVHGRQGTGFADLTTTSRRRESAAEYEAAIHAGASGVSH